MKYKVKTQIFEGPFDLLLSLVSKQKVDIALLSIGDVVNQFLEYVEKMQELDLDITSDFLVVASTLLQIKANSILPKEEDDVPDDASDLVDDIIGIEDINSDKAKAVLFARLCNYKKFKNASEFFNARLETQKKMHIRHAALEPQFQNLMPDFLQGMTLRGLAVICSDLAARQDVFLLESQHIAKKPISIQNYTSKIFKRLKNGPKTSFKQLVGDAASPEIVVVTFLSLLELYKFGVVDLTQSDNFSDLEVRLEDDADESAIFNLSEWE
ncbi:MAG: segregation/condensation protein A [Coriobacteriales bacterium]|nr:segregation/condensation protein A [Coriobacteriales bacterium]